jgi:hypothetical protein
MEARALIMFFPFTETPSGSSILVTRPSSRFIEKVFPFS